MNINILTNQVFICHQIHPPTFMLGHRCASERDSVVISDGPKCITCATSTQIYIVSVSLFTTNMVKHTHDGRQPVIRRNTHTLRQIRSANTYKYKHKSPRFWDFYRPMNGMEYTDNYDDTLFVFFTIHTICS